MFSKMNLSRIFSVGLIAVISWSAKADSAPANEPENARGVVVVTPGLPAAEAKAFALSQDRLLLSDYLDASRPGEDFDSQLRSRLEKAQRAWLSGDQETARTEFRALGELSLKADWREAQREVIQTAFLRLAQSSDSPSEREAWVESAVRLYGDLNPNVALFPPPLLLEFEAVKKRSNLTSVDIDLRDVFPDFRLVIVDGKRIEIASQPRLRLNKGLHRMTAYSDSHEAVTEFLTAAQLRVLRLSPPALTEDSCEKAHLRARASISSSLDTKVFAGSACVGDISRAVTAAQLISRPKSNSDFKSFAASSPLDLPTATSSKKTWLWVVGGAVAAGAAYALTRSHSPEPVHHSGF